MIKADYHTHCNFSTDSDTAPESMILGAIQKEMTHFCFTDHMDLDYPGTTKEKPLFEFHPQNYFETLLPLQQQYKDKLDISIGIELGLRPNRTDLNNSMYQLLADYPFDFTLGSIHILDDKDPYYESYWKEYSSSKNVLINYFNHLLHSIQQFDGFDSLGHLDYIIRYIPDFCGAKDYSYKEHKEIIDEILKILIQKNKALEINTKGLISGLSCFHPKLEILTRYLELGGSLLTIGSDAHEPNSIGTQFKKAEELLLTCGINGYCIYKNHQPQFIYF